MIKILGKNLILLVFIVTSGCVGMLTSIPDRQSSEGQLYIAKCSTCHSVPHPKRHTYNQWEHLITVMEQEMKNRKMEISSEEKNVILNYLKNHSR